MRLIAITSFPPSTRAANSFGYYSILTFLKLPNITEVVILADIIEGEDSGDDDQRFVLAADKSIIIDRCWRYNSCECAFSIVRAVMRYAPDIVWINFQYTIFGVKPLPILSGLCLPAILRSLQYPVILLLHHYLQAVDVNKMGLLPSRFPKAIITLVDKVTMQSLMQSNRVFTMVKDYQKDLCQKYPNADIRYIRQDLFPVPIYKSTMTSSRRILTFGYFGTYKKLEILLEVFETILRVFPDAELVIAGQDNMHTPGYLAQLQKFYKRRLKNVIFAGYIKEKNLATTFWGANVVVVTNSMHSGSSGVIELAHIYGRVILAPQQIWSERQSPSECGVVLYNLAARSDLEKHLISLFAKPELQNMLGKQGYQYTLTHRDSFSREHFQAFQRFNNDKEAPEDYQFPFLQEVK